MDIVDRATNYEDIMDTLEPLHRHIIGFCRHSIDKQEDRQTNRQAKLDKQNWTSKTGQANLEKQNWTIRTGQAKLDKQSWRSFTGQAKLDKQNWTNKTGQKKTKLSIRKKKPKRIRMQSEMVACGGPIRSTNIGRFGQAPAFGFGICDTS